MIEPNRRDFLAAAGTAVATTKVLGAGSFDGGISDESSQEPVHDQIPPHRPLRIEGIHAYTDRVSVAAGEPIRFHVSSSLPYELQICRLGTDVDSVDRDLVLHSFGPSDPRLQPIHPGSYLHVEKRIDGSTDLHALTLEIWIRQRRAIGRQAIIARVRSSHFLRLCTVCERRRLLGFYTGDGGAFQERNLHTSAPGQLKMTINPQGLKIQSDNTPSSVLSDEWHHVVATFGGDSEQLWVDGQKVASWQATGPIRPRRLTAAHRGGRERQTR